MGYTPLFDSLTRGTLCGRWPDIGLWPVVLSLSDKNGVVDSTPVHIAAVTGLQLDDVIACMARFCLPDPYSRTQDHGGARLELLDTHRDWGWRIVNHGKYREKARKAMQQIDATESGRDAERKRVERERASGGVQSRPAVSGADRLSDADAYKEKEGADAPVRNGVKAKRASLVPADFQPDTAFALAELPDCDVDREIAKFRDWEFSKPKSDWPRTWRAWIRRARDKGEYAKKSKQEGTNGIQVFRPRAAS